MHGIVKDILNTIEPNKQLEIYLLNEDVLTGNDLSRMIDSKYASNLLKQQIQSTIDEMTSMSALGYSDYNQTIRDFRLSRNESIASMTKEIIDEEEDEVNDCSDKQTFEFRKD